MAKITVLGSGGWGIALALTAYNSGHDVALWSPFEDEVELLHKNRENKKLLDGVKIPNEITVTTHINIAGGSLMTIIAVPSTPGRKSRNSSQCCKRSREKYVKASFRNRDRRVAS